MEIFEFQYPQMKDLKKTAAGIKLLVLDVDGVLTDGGIIYNSEGHETKAFNVKDGFGIKQVSKLGVLLAIITGRSSKPVEIRGKELGFDHIVQGSPDKLVDLDKILKKHNIQYEAVAYMGDDIPDAIVMEKVGLPTCPQDAVPVIKRLSSFVSEFPGGRGAVRELCDFIAAAIQDNH